MDCSDYKDPDRKQLELVLASDLACRISDLLHGYGVHVDTCNLVYDAVCTYAEEQQMSAESIAEYCVGLDITVPKVYRENK